MAKPKDVESYIVNSVKESQSIMQQLREIIKTTVPKAKEGISWNVPIYKYHGIVAGFDVAKHHVSFGADALQDEDRELLEKEGYKTGKRTIQIKFDQKVPEELIKKILIEQTKMNEAKNLNS